MEQSPAGSRRAAPLSPGERAEVAEIFAALAFDAGRKVMSIYGRADKVRRKADASPVCEADEEAEAIILQGLERRLPEFPVIAEESVAAGKAARPAGDRIILVDPLDGTKEFLSRNGEFTVNIALIEAEAPIAGAVFAPALGRLWLAGAEAFACSSSVDAPSPALSHARRIQTRRAPNDGLIAFVSRSHADPETAELLSKLPVSERREAGSSLKFCLIAEGEADIYPRLGPTMEWDTAAGDAILRSAGGIVTACDGGALRYGKRGQGFRNGSFIAWGDPSCARRI